MNSKMQKALRAGKRREGAQPILVDHDHLARSMSRMYWAEMMSSAQDSEAITQARGTAQHTAGTRLEGRGRMILPSVASTGVRPRIC